MRVFGLLVIDKYHAPAGPHVWRMTVHVGKVEALFGMLIASPQHCAGYDHGGRVGLRVGQSVSNHVTANLPRLNNLHEPSSRFRPHLGVSALTV